MNKVRLYSRMGTFVANVWLPPRAEPPEAVRWKNRVFVPRNGGGYREIAAVEVETVAGEMLGKGDTRQPLREKTDVE